MPKQNQVRSSFSLQKAGTSFSYVIICWVGVLTRAVGQLVMLRTFRFIGWAICWSWGSRLHLSRSVFLWLSPKSLRFFICKIRVVATSQGWCEKRVRSHCEVASEAAKCSDGSWLSLCSPHYFPQHSCSLYRLFQGKLRSRRVCGVLVYIGHDQHPERTERSLNLLTRIPAKWLM